MKTKLIITAMFLALGITLLAWAQTSNPPAQKLTSSASAAQAQSVHASHLPAGFSADAAYKSNCTRCHAEIPKMDARRTKTIVQHMRVRADLTRDEAEAILEYLNK
jgi:hypothetical protein